jgi:4-hydroxy-tetrahydrodipicolinate reductase
MRPHQLDGPRIAIHGASGRLGRLIVHEAGELYAGPVGRGGLLPPCDLVVDVSSPEGLAALLPRLSGQALLVGTTGELPQAALQAYASQAPVAVVPNFSAGVPLLLDLLQHLSGRLPEGWQVELVEAHHAAKRDAPSGTALRLREAIGLPEAPIHSLRAGDTIGEHSLWLAGPGERIELRHVATRREVFAQGAVRLARWLVSQGPGLHRP